MADGHRFPVDRTAIMLFASAIGETNPIYWDEEAAAATPLAGVIAPPTFATASSQWDPSYALRGVRQIPAPPEREKAPEAGSGGGDGGGGGGGNLARFLHAEQRYEYHRPLRPGMELTVSSFPGKRWQKEGRRGGTLHFAETVTEYRDADGELVLTATGVGVRTSKAVED